MRSFTVVVLVCSIGAAGPSATASDIVPPSLRACATVKKNSERLACYDQAMASLSSDMSAEAVFGAAAPRVEREELTSLSARVKALHRDASGALVIDLDNGQQWRQTSGSSVPLLEVGHQVTITRAALNSFRMSTPSGRAFKVKRVN